MNTARTGPPGTPTMSRSASKESTWRPNALRRTRCRAPSAAGRPGRRGSSRPAGSSRRRSRRRAARRPAGAAAAPQVEDVQQPADRGGLTAGQRSVRPPRRAPRRAGPACCAPRTPASAAGVLPHIALQPQHTYKRHITRLDRHSEPTPWALRAVRKGEITRRSGVDRLCLATTNRRHPRFLASRLLSRRSCPRSPRCPALPCPQRDYPVCQSGCPQNVARHPRSSSCASTLHPFRCLDRDCVELGLWAVVEVPDMAVCHPEWFGIHAGHCPGKPATASKWADSPITVPRGTLPGSGLQEPGAGVSDRVVVRGGRPGGPGVFVGRVGSARRSTTQWPSSMLDRYREAGRHRSASRRCRPLRVPGCPGAAPVPPPDGRSQDGPQSTSTTTSTDPSAVAQHRAHPHPTCGGVHPQPGDPGGEEPPGPQCLGDPGPAVLDHP